MNRSATTVTRAPVKRWSSTLKDVGSFFLKAILAPFVTGVTWACGELAVRALVKRFVKTPAGYDPVYAFGTMQEVKPVAVVSHQ